MLFSLLLPGYLRRMLDIESRTRDDAATASAVFRNPKNLSFLSFVGKSSAKSSALFE